MNRPTAIGVVTRGTTNPNRLRRCDRWLVATMGTVLRRAPNPVVVDLGYGASPVTAVELRDRLAKIRPDIRVVGLEIDRARVAAAAPLAGPGLDFRHGGFEIPVNAARDGADHAVVVRAFNVLRQYPEEEVVGAWAAVTRRLTPDGLLIDGTCDELGRLATWVAVTPAGPQSLTLSWRLQGLRRPSVIAERLPKALIHHNTPGEGIHTYLTALDDHWDRAASHATYGVRQRFRATALSLREAGWPILRGPSRWRLGELEVAWSAVTHQSTDPSHQGP
ncbi:MAG: class I SAM-dependent methyltransferase [Phycicoccus sp.]|nr:class I SAM-dependent methyltransferase [Phycicoccus sp.]